MYNQRLYVQSNVNSMTSVNIERVQLVTKTSLLYISALSEVGKDSNKCQYGLAYDDITVATIYNCSNYQ